MGFDKDFLEKFFEQAVENLYLRQNFDLRTSSVDISQRMLNDLLSETVVPNHRHEDTSKMLICLCDKLEERLAELWESGVLDQERLDEVRGMHLRTELFL